jgi:hypothetical protein
VDVGADRRRATKFGPLRALREVTGDREQVPSGGDNSGPQRRQDGFNRTTEVQVRQVHDGRARQSPPAGTIVRSASRRMVNRNGVSRFRISPSIAAPIRDPLVFITIDEAVYVSNLS